MGFINNPEQIQSEMIRKLGSLGLPADVVAFIGAEFKALLGTAAYSSLTSSAYDATPSRVLKVGDFGLGASSAGSDVADPDAIPYSCIFRAFNNSKMPTLGTWVGLNLSRDPGNGRIVQLVFSDIDFSIQLRFRSYLGVWSTWSKIFDQKAVVGTVSQAGGVVTGAIIEKGSNANGEYTKFADGTLICRGFITGAKTTSNYSPSLQYVLVPVTFPAPFVDLSYSLSGGGQDSGTFGWVGLGSPGTTGASVVYYTSGVNPTTSNIKWCAIGRWY